MIESRGPLQFEWVPISYRIATSYVAYADLLIFICIENLALIIVFFYGEKGVSLSWSRGLFLCCIAAYSDTEEEIYFNYIERIGI